MDPETVNPGSMDEAGYWMEEKDPGRVFHYELFDLLVESQSLMRVLLGAGLQDQSIHIQVAVESRVPPFALVLRVKERIQEVVWVAGIANPTYHEEG